MAGHDFFTHSHYGKNLLLIILSLVFLPLDTTILACSYVAGHVLKKRNNVKVPQTGQRTILVTGVGMTKGLVLARLFKKSGHRVIGADFGALSPGRVSNSLDAYHPLQKPTSKAGSRPYIQSLFEIVNKENVELWVSCSGVASAIEDGEAKEVLEDQTTCRAIQFDVATTQTLHEKDSFIQHTEDIGLTVPETIKVDSQRAVEDALRSAPPGRHYIMKPIGMDDSARGDMTLLPKSSAKETSAHLSRLSISKKNPWILQQFISGQEFCTHSLIIAGQVKAFVACHSAELLMYYEALPAESPLSKSMLRFTEQYAAKGGRGFTGHLSFDFLVEKPKSVEDRKAMDRGDIVLYPIECNPRAHTAVALFSDTNEMADAYLSCLESSTKSRIVTPIQPKQYHWIGHDLVTLLLIPLCQFVVNPTSLRDFVLDSMNFAIKLTLWKDGTFDIQDPLPWWWLYHVYWPMQFLTCLRTNTRWSRINVSTLKMFEM